MATTSKGIDGAGRGARCYRRMRHPVALRSPTASGESASKLENIKNGAAQTTAALGFSALNVTGERQHSHDRTLSSGVRPPSAGKRLTKLWALRNESNC